MELEIEKTYLAKYIPSNLNENKYSSIEDLYFNIRDWLNRIRIRKQDDIIELTKKSPTKNIDHWINNEETIILTEIELKNFKDIPCQIIKKKRYYYTLNNINYEIDIFEEGLEWLVMIDVEFKSIEEYENFSMPDFCLCDVTSDKEIAWSKLIWQTFKSLQGYLREKKYTLNS